MNSLDLIDDEKSESTGQNDEIQNYLNLKLDSKWNFYYLRNDRGLPDNSNWNDRLEYIATFETIGEFWATYQHIKLPSYLPQVSLTVKPLYLCIGMIIPVFYTKNTVGDKTETECLFYTVYWNHYFSRDAITWYSETA